MIRALPLIILFLAHLALHAQEFTEMTSQTDFGRTGFNRGVSIGDFDNDGLEDIYVSRIDGPNLLYRNLGDFKFEEVGEEYGLNSNSKTNTSLWFDVDGDGDLDLFLVNSFQRNILYRNDGDSFSDVTGQYGVGTNANSKTAHVADYDNDGDLDLYVTVFFENNILWRNENGTRFVNVTADAGIADAGRSLGALFVDFDLDGDMDIYQTRDGDDPNLLFKNNGDGTFTEAAGDVGLWYDGQGMGTDIADLNLDARPDIYLTNLYENKLYLSTSDGGYEEVSTQAGVDDIGMGWSSFFFDCNNNGLQDIYLANDSYFGVNGQSDIKNKIYINNGDGTYTTPDYTGNIQNEFGTFGAAYADFDLDGRLDIVLANHGNNDGNQIFRNISELRNYVGFRLTARSSNLYAIGARIHFFSGGVQQVKYLTAGSGYASQNTRVMHFGMDDIEVADSAVVYWPSGRVQVLYDLSANQVYDITEDFVYQQGQVVWTDPAFPTQEDDVTVYFNAAEGNGALSGFDGEVFAHTGVITNLSPNETAWRHVIGNWGTFDSRVLMTRVEEDIYSLSYNIDDFYSVPGGETVSSLAFVFRNVDGSIVGRDVDGSDIYTPVFPPNSGLVLLINSPASGNSLSSVITLEDSLLISVQTNVESMLRVFDSGEEIFSSADGSAEFYYYPSEVGAREFEFVATTEEDTATAIRTAYVTSESVKADAPPGVRDGINYTDTSYIFQLFAPGKSWAYLMCPANGWQLDEEFRMKQTTDGDRVWIEVMRSEFADGNRLFQYATNGALIGDPYSELVLDPVHDPFVDADIMAELPDYPQGASGLVTYFDESEEDGFIWQYEEEYEKPAEDNLVIYELLVRDFLESHRYHDLIDTLDYLERLGVNAIEIMPVNEFEGNLSWGYNPSYHGAIDKYYGTRDQLKQLIDEVHRRDMAVIFDVVFNQSFSQGPLAQLYFDRANFRPAPESPYLNVVARHPFNVGYDFNHESEATRYWVKRTLEHMLEEFHVDGFRFDLAKGFTQRFSGDDLGYWNQYDERRIAILKEYADFIWAIDSTSYIILEHFGDNNELKELADYGMMQWTNQTRELTESAMGYQGTWRWLDYSFRGWKDPKAVVYMDGHDEQRMIHDVLNYGDRDGDYNTRDLETALERIAAVSAVLFSIPGPKMLWQFSELGYEYSINYCPDGTIDEGCRTAEKPIRWDYYDDKNRRKLYDKMAAIIHLKTNYPTFRTRDYTLNDGNFFIKYVTLRHPEMDAHTVANFRVTASNINPRFPYEGTWYDYLSGDSIVVNDLNARVDFGPGEYHIYTSTRITPPGGYFTSTAELRAASPLTVWPNPAAEGDDIHVSWKIGEEAKSVELISIDGSQVGISSQNLGDQIRIRPTRQIAPGVYVIRIVSDDQLYTGRVVVGG